MSTVIPFQFDTAQVRVIQNENGEPWFVAKDVCDVLGIRTDSLRYILDDDEIAEVNPNSIGVGHGGRNMLIVSESGLYSATLRSRKSEAKPFRKWVTSEVLPSIRKTGGYIQVDEGDSDDAIMAKALMIADKTIANLKTKANVLEAKVEADRHKVLFTESIETSKDSILVRDLAKLIQQSTGTPMGGNRLFIWLRENGFLIRAQGTDYNMPTQRSMGMGLFEIKESTYQHPEQGPKLTKTPKVTGKGQVYFVNKFTPSPQEAA